MDDSNFPTSNSDSQYGSIDEVLLGHFSDNMLSWWDPFSDFGLPGWGFGDRELPSLDLNMFPVEPLFFDLEDFLNPDIIDPGWMSADVNPPLFDMNLFLASSPSNEPFDILAVFNSSSPPPPPPPPPRSISTIRDGGSEADTDQSTSPEADPEITLQEGDNESQDIVKDMQDLRKRKRDGAPGESDEDDGSDEGDQNGKDITDIASKKPKYEDMCDILDFRPPEQQRKRLPSRAKLTATERRRVALVRRAGACEECRRKKKRCTHVNFEQRHIIVFDRASSLPELCLEILRIKVNDDSNFASSAISFSIQVRALFKRQMGTGATRFLMHIAKENNGRGLSVKAQGGAEAGTVKFEQHNMALWYGKKLLRTNPRVRKTRRVLDFEIAAWLILLAYWRKFLTLLLTLLKRLSSWVERSS